MCTCGLLHDSDRQVRLEKFGPSVESVRNVGGTWSHSIIGLDGSRIIGLKGSMSVHMTVGL